MSRNRTRSWIWSLAPVLVLAIALSACGGSSSSSTDSGAAETTAAGETAESGSSAVEAAAAEVEEFAAVQPAAEVPPLPEQPAGGKSVGIVTCGFPSCQETTKAVEEAAEALGWSTKSYISEVTPESYASTWDSVLQDSPDAIVYTGLFPNENISKQLAEVEDKEIPAVAIAAWDGPGGALQAVYNGAPQLEQSGELMGAAVVAEGGAEGKSVLVWDPKTLMGPVQEGYAKAIQGAGGSFDELEISALETGKAVPGQVVSYLQAHPDVEFAVFAISDFATGVPQAVKGAGLTGVKIAGRVPHPANIKEIQGGGEWTQIAEETAGSGYRAIDAIARIEQDVSFEKYPAGWHRIVNAGNADEPGVANQPGVPDSFLEAWHVNGG
ncbi:MAG: hypothetical protein R2725_00525 [Solirubrobacterales bacterium]